MKKCPFDVFVEIWEVEGEEIPLKPCLNIDDISCGYLKLGMGLKTKTYEWPPGTVMLKSCRLVEQKI